ncbi:NAD(P)/FAD-dependent oxidoreductase [Chlorobium phaeobacteroides]|uniref:NADH:ubiquinone reductase (non-electrogenic) n=1 Tax=Chlorobium phaeobacteroides (strain DSM 266 / SMG 266 / 2430) TaxID=290317 RepID=A1BFD7_CHLPD|nr:NAD(P)/FAD-dependent oxidoreductase [Chlorobium phaeobacteroides]ABL65114.1 NADH dehydrogenase [Chlorobium phaeobacteroides DSM 266]
MKHVVIVGGGFAGLNVAKELGNKKDIRVTLIDKNNFQLFQPLLYQVAMAALNAGEIAYPLRIMLSKYKNVTVLKGVVKTVDPRNKTVYTDFGEMQYDSLVLCCGAKHHYFGHNEWEEFAPGLKTIGQASEIRRRVMEAFENAERSQDVAEKRKLLTFVIVGGGPTGVELAGSIGEMSRYYLSKYYRNIDPKLTRIFIVHSAPRILQTFSPELSSKATRALEKLGVQVWTCSLVSRIDADGVQVGNEKIEAGTVLWAAGVRATSIGKTIGFDTDHSGRIIVEDDLTVRGYPDVFTGGDQAHFALPGETSLPGLASVALQQGQAIGRNILLAFQGKPKKPFKYRDKGQMATIGKNAAIAERGNVKLSGLSAWIIWLGVHIYYLSGVKHRLFVILQWAWSYFTFGHAARIVNNEWRFYTNVQEPAEPAEREELMANPACVFAADARQ